MIAAAAAPRAALLPLQIRHAPSGVNTARVFWFPAASRHPLIAVFVCLHQSGRPRPVTACQRFPSFPSTLHHCEPMNNEQSIPPIIRRPMAANPTQLRTSALEAGVPTPSSCSPTKPMGQQEELCKHARLHHRRRGRGAGTGNHHKQAASPTKRRAHLWGAVDAAVAISLSDPLPEHARPARGSKHGNLGRGDTRSLSPTEIAVTNVPHRRIPETRSARALALP